MNTDDLRMECLRLALARCGTGDPRPLLVIADEIYGWAAERPSPPAAPAPKRKRLSGWVNVYPCGVVSSAHESKAEANRIAAWDANCRIACIDLSQHYKGEGL